MSTKALKENGIKYNTKSPKISKNRQGNSKNELKEYMKYLSPSSTKLNSRKSSTKNINNNYKSSKKFRFTKKTARGSASPIYHTSLQKNFNKENLDKIEQVDKITLGKKQFWNSFNRSTSSKYIPLSIKSKLESFKDIDKLSVERFKKYNSIFEKIKEQIYDINQVYKSFGATIEANSSMDFQNNSTTKNINNKEKKNSILNISNDFIDLDKQIKEEEKKESKLEEKETLDNNNINIYQNCDTNKNKNLYYSFKTEQSNKLNNKNKNDFVNNTPLSEYKKYKNPRIILLKKNFSLKLMHEFDNPIYDNKIKLNKIEDKNNEKIFKKFKKFLEKRNIENISFINNKSKLNNQIFLKTNNKYLKISNSTNLFYEGESYCKCERCLIY